MKYNATLIRFSEIALKSKPVRRRLENILVRNIKDAMKKNGISGKVLKRWERIIIETEEYEKIISPLKRVFGIVSFSPAIKIQLGELEKFFEENSREIIKGSSFAVRVKRSGVHNFTSKEMEIKLGDVIVKKTKKTVNLSNPDTNVFVEIRNDEVFIYFEVIKGSGGAPLGSEDKVICHIENKDDLVACWLMMKRGCKPIVYSKIKIDVLEKWSYGLKIKKVTKKIFEHLKKSGIPIVKGLSIKQIKPSKHICFYPLATMKKEDINRLYNKINIKENT